MLLLVLLGATAAAPLWAIGASPGDPIPFDTATGAIPLTVRAGSEVWVRARYVPASTVSHLVLETQGGLDTDLAVFASRSEALAGQPLAEDDDSGAGTNAAVRVPLGFPSPYLVRLRASRAGSLTLHARFVRVAAQRCNWPEGCSLAVAARGEPTGREVLGLLRRVRGEVLERTRAGRELNGLYWRLGADLIPDLLADARFRKRAYQEVTTLLPLAHGALGAAAGTGGRERLSRADYERLRDLLELVGRRLSPELAAELRMRWDEYDLDRAVGTPLATVMQERGLLPSVDARYTVIMKLRAEPARSLAGGALRLRTGDTGLDARLAAAGVAAVRPVHRGSPERRAAGLTRTIAFEVEGLAAAHELAQELASDPAVEWAEVPAILHLLAGTGETDPYRSELWGLNAVRAPQAWNLTRGTCSTRVAVVDTGLRKEVADLQGRILPKLGYDFVDDDPDPEDGHGHGTHVAGTVVGTLDNAVSIAGVAPEACLFAVRVIGDDGTGTAEGVAAGIVHAVDAGARVINLSLGCDCETQQVIEDALRYAAQHDVVVVAAAGNDGAEGLNYPASSPRTIAVAAVDRNLSLASFSNYGPGLDLAAPGVDVVSVFRDGESCTGSGTSMATPHVSGVAALVRSANPGMDREAVRDVLRKKATDLGAPGYDPRFGAGLVNASAAVAAAGGAGPFFSSDGLPGFRFRVRFTAGNQVIAGRPSSDCVAETLCVSGALPGRSELFVRIVGPRPNGFLWTDLVRFTPSRAEVWIEQVSTGTVNYYDLSALGPAQNELTGLVDKRSFRPTGSAAGAPTPSERSRSLETPGVTAIRPGADGFTSSAFPGFRFKVHILAGGVELPSRVERDCLAETVCVSGSVPGRAELFLRIIGPRPNGYLWVNLVRFTTSRVEVEIEQLSSGVVRRYVLSSVPPGSDGLPGRVDKEAFRP